MELKELKCKNCGAKIELEEGKTEVTCKYCNTTFKVDDEYSKAYNYTKGILKAHNEQMQEFYNSREGKLSKIIINIIIIIVFLIFFLVIGLMISNIYNYSPIRSNVIETKNESIDANMFNIQFSDMNGQKSTFFINDYLDEIVTNNKKQQEHIITVKYQDKETSNPDEIIAIKKSLDESKQYELSTDYDQAGFINKLTITE